MVSPLPGRWMPAAMTSTLILWESQCTRRGVGWSIPFVRWALSHGKNDGGRRLWLVLPRRAMTPRRLHGRLPMDSHLWRAVKSLVTYGLTLVYRRLDPSPIEFLESINDSG